MIGKFIISLIFAGVVLSVVSIAWPRFTTAKRPAPIKDIQSAVKDTPFGVSVSQVLGVSDEVSLRPINIADTANGLKDWMITQIQNKAEAIVVKQAVDQINTRFNALTDDQKSILKQAICSSASDSAALR
jgi:hypothetical protein